MDLHVITSRGAALVAQVVDGKLVIPPVPPAQSPAGAAPDPSAPGR